MTSQRVSATTDISILHKMVQEAGGGGGGGRKMGRGWCWVVLVVVPKGGGQVDKLLKILVGALLVSLSVICQQNHYPVVIRYIWCFCPFLSA